MPVTRPARLAPPPPSPVNFAEPTEPEMDADVAPPLPSAAAPVPASAPAQASTLPIEAAPPGDLQSPGLAAGASGQPEPGASLSASTPATPALPAWAQAEATSRPPVARWAAALRWGAWLGQWWPRRASPKPAPASDWSFATLSSRQGSQPPLDGETLMVPPPPPPLPGMMALLDLQQRCLAASPGLARWLGTDRDLLLGLPLVQVMGRTATEVLAPQVEAALAGHLRRLRCCHVGANGAERWLQVELQPHSDEYGERVGCHLLAMDVTPEHRQWQSTQRSERRLRFMLDQVPATVAYIDTDMRFRHVNRHQARWLGVTEAEASGVPVRQLVDASTWAELQPDLATALSGVALPSHRQLVDAHGQATWQTGQHVPELHSDGRVLGMVSVFVDQAEPIAPAIKRPAEGAGQAELVLDLQANSPLRPWLTAQHGPDASVLALMNDALDLARLSAGELHPEQLDFHLVPALEHVVQLLAPRAHAKQLELCCRIDPMLPEGLRGDPQWLHQVIAYLLDNAVKHTLAGEVLLDVQRQGPELLRLAVHDTGIGLSAERQQQLSELLTGRHDAPAPRPKGSGLGLTVVRALVHQMGGQLGVQSSPGEGATFWFTLPLVAAEGLPPLARPVPLPAHHVLVVDDNATSRAIIAQHLCAGGQRCSTSATAADALAALRSAQRAGDPVRVALVDVRMPGTDGISLAASVRADPSLADTQLVLMTAQQSRQDLARARQAGVAAYLCKPVRGPDLYRALSQALAAARGPAWLLEKPAPTTASPLPDSEALPVLHARVLLADGDSQHQSAASEMLKALGCDLVVLGDGQATLQALRMEHFDLVLIACRLPGLDGLGVTRAIRQREQDSHTRRRQAVVGMRRAGDEGLEADACLAAGMDEVLGKPFTRRQLAEAMARCLPPELVELADAGLDLTLLPIPPGTVRLSAVPPRHDLSPDHLLDPLVLDQHPGARAAGEPGGADPLARNQVIHDFVNALPGQLQAMRRALLEGQPDALAVAAGRLALASHSVGAGTLGELCGRLDKLGQAGQLTGAAELLAAVEAVIDRLLPVLHAEVRMAA